MGDEQNDQARESDKQSPTGAPPDREELTGDEVPVEEPSSGENICPECDGSGEVGGETCQKCAGSGRINEAIGGG